MHFKTQNQSHPLSFHGNTHSILTQRNPSLRKFTLCLHASFYLRANNYWLTILRAFSSVQFSCSVVSDSGTPWTTACQASLSITNSRSLLKLMSIESVMPSNHLILCHPLFLLPSVFPSVKVFSNESALRIRYVNWPSSVLHAKSLQWYLTLCDPMDYSQPGSSDHGILQARILEWVVIPSFKESSQHRDRTRVSCIAGRFFTVLATWEAHLALSRPREGINGLMVDSGLRPRLECQFWALRSWMTQNTSLFSSVKWDQCSP